MEESQLLRLIIDTGLETVKADTLLVKFDNFEQIARKWEAEAKSIIVTDETQVSLMERAREGRLILKDKRVSIEKTRKALKEESLREGQAIDKIARYLKDLIEPIENYLEEQERFVELKQAREAAEKAERERIEREAAEAKVEAARKAEEAAERERLNIEIEVMRKKLDEERKAKAEADRIAAEEKKKADEILRQERMKTEAAEKVRKKAEDDAAAARERVRVVQTRKNEEIREVRRENVELKKMMICPKCGHKFASQ